MRKILWSAVCAAVAIAAVGCGGDSEMVATSEQEPAETAPADPKELDVADVAGRLAAGEDIFLLDVRTPEELVQDGAIKGHTHIPIDELEGRLAEVPKDKPIVAY